MIMPKYELLACLILSYLNFENAVIYFAGILTAVLYKKWRDRARRKTPNTRQRQNPR